MKRRFTAEQKNNEIIRGLDIMAEYESLGVRFQSDAPRSSGKASCYSAFRDEKKPSAWIDTNTGHYGDSGSGEKAITLWEFAVRRDLFTDWQAARKHFADKAGVELTPRKSTRAKRSNRPQDVLEFVEWTAGGDRLLDAWCIRGKKGVCPEAVKLAGGRLAHYPCYRDKKTGERKRGKYCVIALPCYGEQLLDADPVAWVLYNITGAPLDVYTGKGRPKELVKMKSVGPTRGTMMNAHSLGLLDRREEELVWKTAGPSDMLAVLTAILRDSPELLEKHLVVTNASSETGDVLPHQAALLADRRVYLAHDADEAGEAGAAKWFSALWNLAKEVRKVTLPFHIRKKSGLDIRDYLNGVPEEGDTATGQQLLTAA